MLIPSRELRARCGFADYFVPGKYVDHWIVEDWADTERWVRIDPEHLGTDVVRNPHDLAHGQFLTGGESWECVRRGAADPMHFGVAGTENWGAAEIRGNAIRDLASLNKVEMLPWDAWGLLEASYRGETGPEVDRLIDDVAVAPRRTHLGTSNRFCQGGGADRDDLLISGPRCRPPACLA